MAQAHSSTPSATPTREIAEWVAGKPTVDATAKTWARHCLLDWLAVSLPGAREDLVDILVAEALADGSGAAPLVGRSETVAPSWAVLINGAASHALDYDDVNTAMHGHPTVAVMPAVLLAAARDGRTLDDALTAFAIGYEVCCLVGEMTGDAHYDTGWHATATVGTFGAAAGMSALMGLSADQTAHALGSAATMAAGLKSMFGTMCKPFHAGRAAQSGWMAARMAARNWVARDDALECPQGFWDTQAPDHAAFALATRDNGPLQITQNLFKYNAACYMTHSAIEACKSLRDTHDLDPTRIDRVRVRVAEGHLKVCNIPAPCTGLEVKFSLRHTAAMALSGVDTGAIGNYSDQIARRPDLIALRKRVEVEPQAVARTMATGADVVVDTTDGMTLTNAFDVGIPATDLAAQEARLSAKFDALVTPVLGSRSASLRDMVLNGNASPSDIHAAAR